jgi:transcriptional antiterminator RfaH
MRQASVMTKWLVLMIHRHQEEQALKNLQRQNFKAYCPMLARHIRHARRAYDVKRPLFPGYLFLEMPTHPHGLRQAANTLGVRNFVLAGDKPASLPDGFVEGLMAREENGAICGPGRPLRPGENVKILGGPFDGLIAQITQLTDGDRALLLLDILNRPTRVRIETKRLM